MIGTEAAYRLTPKFLQKPIFIPLVEYIAEIKF